MSDVPRASVWFNECLTCSAHPQHLAFACGSSRSPSGWSQTPEQHKQGSTHVVLRRERKQSRKVQVPKHTPGRTPLRHRQGSDEAWTGFRLHQRGSAVATNQPQECQQPARCCVQAYTSGPTDLAEVIVHRELDGLLRGNAPQVRTQAWEVGRHTHHAVPRRNRCATAAPRYRPEAPSSLRMVRKQ